MQLAYLTVISTNVWYCSVICAAINGLNYLAAAHEEYRSLASLRLIQIIRDKAHYGPRCTGTAVKGVALLTHWEHNSTEQHTAGPMPASLLAPLRLLAALLTTEANCSAVLGALSALARRFPAAQPPILADLLAAFQVSIGLLIMHLEALIHRLFLACNEQCRSRDSCAVFGGTGTHSTVQCTAATIVRARVDQGT